jgi:hypothetical protein
MKIKKTFFITFIITYILIGYLSAIVVGIKWDESATMLIRFLERARMALTDGYLIKILISLVCAVIANLQPNKK